MIHIQWLDAVGNNLLRVKDKGKRRHIDIVRFLGEVGRNGLQKLRLEKGHLFIVLCFVLFLFFFPKKEGLEWLLDNV